MIVVTNGMYFFIYDGLSGGALHGGQLQSPNNYQPYALWVYKESPHFATCYKTNGKLTIGIQGFQPTPNSLSSTFKSFPVPSINGDFSFSPVSFHASFVTETEVVVVDVRGSKILFHTKATEPLYNPPGQFSPNGSFLACKTWNDNIHIWRNTPTGYAPWSTLQPRLPFDGFSFSPTAILVLTWGIYGIQVLHPESSVSSPYPNKIKPLFRQANHLMACSVDGPYIVIAQKWDNAVMVLDSILGTTIQSIHVGMKIMAIGIVGGTILVAGRHRLTSWNLGVEGGAIVSCSHDIAPIGEYIQEAGRLVLSNDCSQVAFASDGAVILYNITSQTILVKHVLDGTILDIQFSQDENLLYACSCKALSYDDATFYLAKFETGGVRCLASVTKGNREDKELWERFFPPSQKYHVESSKWVLDPSGHKCLWLPPHWRTTSGKTSITQ